MVSRSKNAKIVIASFLLAPAIAIAQIAFIVFAIVLFLIDLAATKIAQAITRKGK